jgi:hypothetical protein
MNKQNKIAMIAALASCAVGNLMAGDFNNFVYGDVMLAFRAPSSTLLVDAGQVSTLTSLSTNQSYTIPGYTSANFTSANTVNIPSITSFNGLNWSAIAWQDDGSLFMTRARSSSNLAAQSRAWLSSGGYSSQELIINNLYAITAGASAVLGNAADSANTATAVLEPDSSSSSFYTDLSTSGLSFHDVIDPVAAGLFNYGSFQGDTENTTPNTFSTSGSSSISDLYKFSPTGSVSWLGYFQLATNGGVTYVAYPISTPVITSITRSDSLTTITYTTGPYGTYTLRGTTNLQTAGSPTSWISVATLANSTYNSSLGSYNVVTVQDTDSTAIKFYTITAQ